MIHDDELADVNLDGVPLVTANWRAWSVPPEAAAFESVADWWHHLHLRELRLPPQAAAHVKELVDILSSPLPSNKDEARARRRERTALLTERLLEDGLRLTQIEEVTGVDAARLMGPQRLLAWQLVEGGATASQVQGRIPTLPLRVIRRYVNIREGVANRRVSPEQWRQEAFELFDQGHTVKQIVEVLSERHRTTVNYQRVYGWLRRAGRRERDQVAS